MAGDYQDYIRNIGIYHISHFLGIFCDFTFQGHGAIHNKNEVSTRAIATSMGFREGIQVDHQMFFFFSVGSPIFFG